ncbi:MAG: IclR family transcriptional regulator [Betaproteobacteria bacterium]|nr:IclR family transcriptional regulator [Betaproteobacteria bacterium]
MKTDNNRSGIQVIDRLATLLETLVRNGGSASLKTLSAESGLHPSTAFRILSSAADNGLIDRVEGGQYRMGGKIMQWGCALQGGTNLPEVARPIMEWLRNKVEETVNLTLHEGDEVVYIERVTPRRMMRVEQVIGSHAPLHVTAVGKLMLGAAGRDAVKAYAARTGLPAYTDHTITSASKLWSETSRCHKQGYALDNEEAEIGVGCIGALIRNSAGAIVAGLSISAPVERRQVEEWVPLIQEAARRISERLHEAGIGRPKHD